MRLRIDSFAQTSCIELHRFGNQDADSYTRGMRRLQNIDLKSSSLKGKLSLPGVASDSESESEVALSRPRGKTKPSEAERQTAKMSEEDALTAMGNDKVKLQAYAKASLPTVANICFAQ